MHFIQDITFYLNASFAYRIRRNLLRYYIIVLPLLDIPTEHKDIAFNLWHYIAFKVN